mmetsp:Transcript_67914/g.171240  ORF Transcript_67914/g.171240 Transcript_67914/m.171240 type:complete len:346 (-) Transcript_67914:785-1822(-)
MRSALMQRRQRPVAASEGQVASVLVVAAALQAVGVSRWAVVVASPCPDQAAAVAAQQAPRVPCQRLAHVPFAEQTPCTSPSFPPSWTTLRPVFCPQPPKQGPMLRLQQPLRLKRLALVLLGQPASLLIVEQRVVPVPGVAAQQPLEGEGQQGEVRQKTWKHVEVWYRPAVLTLEQVPLQALQALVPPVAVHLGVGPAPSWPQVLLVWAPPGPSHLDASSNHSSCGSNGSCSASCHRALANRRAQTYPSGHFSTYCGVVASGFVWFLSPCVGPGSGCASLHRGVGYGSFGCGSCSFSCWDCGFSDPCPSYRPLSLLPCCRHQPDRLSLVQQRPLRSLALMVLAPAW